MEKINLIRALAPVVVTLFSGVVSQNVFATTLKKDETDTSLVGCSLQCFGMQGNVARAAGLCKDC